MEEEALSYGFSHYTLRRSVNEIALKTTIEKEMYLVKKDVGQLPISVIEAVKGCTLTFLSSARTILPSET